VQCTSKSDTTSKYGQLEPSQDHTTTYRESMKLRNYKNSHFEKCTHTSESTHVKVQNIFHMRNNVTCSTYCKYRTAKL
jgi:hypothetical protein